MGTGRALKEHNPAIRVISVHPNNEMHGIGGMKYLGKGSIPGIFDMSFPDDRLFVSTESAYDLAKRLAREEGIFVGHSSGAALAAEFTLAGNLEEGTIVAMFPDSGDRYLSTEV